LIPLVCFARVSCGWCSEEPAAEPVQQTENDVFARISKAVKEVYTLSSAFGQERHTPMLKDAMISKGRFLFARPGRIRWETVDPVPAGFSVNCPMRLFCRR